MEDVKLGDLFVPKYSRDTFPLKVEKISYEAWERTYELKPIKGCGATIIVGEAQLNEKYWKVNH